MTDYQMEEIYGLVDEAFKGGQDKIQLAAFPFRMTTQNLARHADNPNVPFWEMLKSGDDAFFATERPPSVTVCDQRYVFNPPIISTQTLLARPALQQTLPAHDSRLLNC
jgi:murein L,D-transpeptidase YafK